MTVTFIIEAMAAANAVITWQNLQVLKRSYDVGTLFPFWIIFKFNHFLYNFGNISLIFVYLCLFSHSFFQFDSREELISASASVNEADFDTDDPSAALLPPTQDATARLERMPLHAHGSTLVYYKLEEKFELGAMAALFFNDLGRVFFYLCISIYLYGDLSIYLAAVAKSLRDLFW